MDSVSVVSNAPSYGCTACVQFPMIKPDALTNIFIDQVVATGKPKPPHIPAITEQLVTSLVAEMKNDNANFGSYLPSTAAIQANRNISLLSSAAVRTLWKQNDPSKGSMPTYKCDNCPAIYIFPQDIKDAAEKAGCDNSAALPHGDSITASLDDTMIQADGLSYEGVKDICVNAMRKAYRGLNVGKAEKAEVYCYKEFVVMLCLPASKEKEELEDPVKDVDLPVFDVGGFLGD